MVTMQIDLPVVLEDMGETGFEATLHSAVYVTDQKISRVRRSDDGLGTTIYFRVSDIMEADALLSRLLYWSGKTARVFDESD